MILKTVSIATSLLSLEDVLVEKRLSLGIEGILTRHPETLNTLNPCREAQPQLK